MGVHDMPKNISLIQQQTELVRGVKKPGSVQEKPTSEG